MDLLHMKNRAQIHEFHKNKVRGNCYRTGHTGMEVGKNK